MCLVYLLTGELESGTRTHGNELLELQDFTWGLENGGHQADYFCESA